MKTGRIVLLVVLVAATAFGGWYAVKTYMEGMNGNGAVVPSPQPQTGKGKLVVLVVFDQMRGDYLERWASSFGPDGFERLKRDGVWFSNCHIPYACTSTAPGHASIATGAPPSVHGIVENAWLEYGSGKLVYCVQPTREFNLVPPLPTGAGRPERGSESGYSPENLLAATVSDALRSQTSGKSRVVSISIKDRAAVLMGGKPATGSSPTVYCFDVRDGKFHTDTYYANSNPPWVREFNDNRGHFDKWVGKDWTRLREDLDYNTLAGPDEAPGEDYGVHQGRKFPHPMNANAKSGGPEYYRALEISPFGNEVLLEFAKAAIVGENLGGNDATDLLCLSFSSNDLIGHRWGPDSWEVLDVTLRSDVVMKNLLAFLDARFGKDRYSLVLTADHGVCPIPEHEPKRYSNPDRRKIVPLLTDLAAALDTSFGAAESPGQWFASLEFEDDLWPWVYLNRGGLEKRGLPLEAVSDYAAQWLGNRGFTSMAFTRNQIETDSLPTLPPEQEKEARALMAKVKLAFRPDRCGDVIVIPRPGVIIAAAKYENGTGHGSPYPYDSHVPVLALGGNIPSVGKREERVSSLIVAPLLSSMLGIKPPESAREAIPDVIQRK